MTAVDLFAGPGGWSLACRHLGISETGVELDPSACRTREAAGFATVQADVRTLDPLAFPAVGLIASPPCQTFSAAGKGAGRAALEEVRALAHRMELGESLPESVHDERTLLVLEPLRWALARHDAGDPYRWIALEQVPTVLPVWQTYAEILRGRGYSVAVGNLQAEQYGVPQTRKRAILVARLNGEAVLPTPTHSKFYPRDKKRLDPDVKPWVCMAEALGWGATERPSMTVTGGGTATGGAEPFGNAARQGLIREQEMGRWALRSNYGTGGDPRNRGERGADEPAPTVTSKIDRNRWLVQSAMANATVRHESEPAPTITAAHDRAERRWVFAGAGQTAIDTAGQVRRDPEEPAHTITGKATAAWVSSAESVRVSVTEAAVLQSFPAAFPWQGPKTKQYQQVGNAIPPMLAEAILETVVDR